MGRALFFDFGLALARHPILSFIIADKLAARGAQPARLIVGLAAIPGGSDPYNLATVWAFHYATSRRRRAAIARRTPR